MYSVTAKLKDIDTTEGSYKNKLIAERHKRRLEKKYPDTAFGIEQVAKNNKNNVHVFYAVKGHIERGEL